MNDSMTMQAEYIMVEKKENHEFTMDVVTAIMGLGALIQVRIIGLTCISELAGMALFPFALRSFLRRGKSCHLLFLLAFLGVLGSCVSNFYNDVNMLDFAKGVFSRVLVLVNIPVCYWILEHKPKRIFIFAVGFGISWYLASSVFVTIWGTMLEVFEGQSFLYAVFPVICYLFYYRGYRLTGKLLLFGFAVNTLFSGLIRSTFLCLGVGILLAFYFEIHAWKPQVRRKLSIGFLFISVISFWLVALTYSYLAGNEFLGEKAYEKYMYQKYSSELGLVAGRMDFFMGLMAVAERPFWGYGDYAMDTTNIKGRFCAKFNIPLAKGGRIIDNYMPSHSQVLNAWIGGGILGALFWLYYLYFMIRHVVRNIGFEPQLILLESVTLTGFLFNMLFNPGVSRLEFSIWGVYMLIIAAGVAKIAAEPPEQDKNDLQFPAAAGSRSI